MTETQRTLHLLEEAEYVVSSLLELERDDLEKGLGDYMALKPKMEVLLRKTSKYRKFLAIKDPSRQIYGPKMLEKMRDMCSRFEDVDERFEEQLQPIYESIEAEHKRRLQEMDLEERRRREEEFQRRVQEGIQETYLEEKRRLERLKERQEAERRRLEELDRLNQHEKERLDEVNRRVAAMAEFIRSLETGGALDEFADTDVYSKVEMEDLKVVGVGILLLLRQESELKEFYTCLGLISDLLVSILRDPSDIKYRLTEERREYYEILASETDLGLNISRLNSDDEYIVLREPDPIDKFELWVSWMENLALISDILVRSRSQKSRYRETTGKHYSKHVPRKASK
ncbi:putative signal peptide-containing protein [Cryptosporidium canis]|nr:putative signal peptide-containing protein [Cryptosporidium canis]